MVDDTIGRDKGNTTDAIAAPGDAAEEALEQRPSDQVPGQGEVQLAHGYSTACAMWQEGTPGHGVIKLRGLPLRAGEEATLGNAEVNNHSASISEHKAGAGRASGISFAWVESLVGDTSGVGRIMWQSFRGGTIGELVDVARLPAPANDNATWVADLNGMGVIGCEPTVTGLHGGDTLVTWIGTDGHAHGRLYASREGDAGSSGGDGPEYASVNAALGDLGPAATTPDGGRRLQVVEPRPGTFAIMWLALADSSHVLRGSLFLSPANCGPNEDRGGPWTEYPFTDTRLPHGFTGEFSVTGVGQGSADLVVAYSELSGATNAINVFARRIDGSGIESRFGQAGPEYLLSTATVTEEASDTAMRAVAGHEAVTQPDGPLGGTPSQAPTLPNDGHGNPPASIFTVAATPGINETTPIVKMVEDGFAVAWQTPGSSDGAVQIRLTLYDEHAVPKSPHILVTDNAAADVPPAISGLGGGVAAAYVHADDRALAVKAFDAGGAQIGDETLVDTGQAGAISEIAIGSSVVRLADGEVQDQVAVVYVRDDGHSDEGNADYGSMLLQRYGIAAEDGQPQRLVELGRDGKHDGADDPAQLTTETDGDLATSEVVFGRAPVVRGLDDGLLAVAWVESQGALETIKGCVLGPDGEQVLLIDLTDMLGNQGIAAATKPILLDSSDGDILVSWLQPDSVSGSYVVMAARYEADGAGGWVKPDQPIRLQEFQNEPEEFSVALSKGEETFISVTWRPDGSESENNAILSHRYDIDGNGLGRTVTVAGNRVLDAEQALSTDTFSAAGLLDGSIVVVYAEESENGDVDLAAHIIDAPSINPGDRAPVAVAKDTSDGWSDDAVLAEDNIFVTAVNQEIAINVLANGEDAGSSVSRINGVPITGATPADIGFGWVQLREDGWLTVNPDAGYTGAIAFDYTVANKACEYTKRATVDVIADAAPAAVTLLNQITSLAEGLSTSAGIKVADIARLDGQVGADGLSLAGLDAGMFKIVDSGLFLNAGSDLDFEDGRTLSVEVRVNHGSGPDGAANFTLNVAGASEPATHGPISDAFLFAPGYGHANFHHEVIDVSSSGYTTFQQLVDSGALVQAGDDVVITLDPANPADSYKITLKGAELSVLTDSDFKFS